MVRDRILATRPKAVLIEGPADFNDRIDELLLDHKPPISIYSYVAWNNGSRQGAYYPLCEYSPEWQAIQAARQSRARIRFIDLPFAATAHTDHRTHRYADDQLRASHYVQALCHSLEVESFDDAWDLIVEHDPHLSTEAIYQRVDSYCRSLREMDRSAVPEHDLARERHMAAHIHQAYREFGPDQVLVITGGYHTSGLEELLANPESLPGIEVRWPDDLDSRGIALTPYSYERLDSLTGYEAGMPSPGFYHEAWKSDTSPFYQILLGRIVDRLRKLKQTASTADLIAVETSAQALASLRGHARVWRRDLIDGVISALVKDDLRATHPFLLATQRVLRGGEHGQLAIGSPLPPLVRDIHHQLATANLSPTPKEETRTLNLTDPQDLQSSQLLQRLRILEISGFDRLAGVDFTTRTDLTSLQETWSLYLHPQQDAEMIEASRYGSALHEAVAACLRDHAKKLAPSALQAALLLLDSVLAGLLEIAQELHHSLAKLIREDSDLTSVATAMDHLLFLFNWDETFRTRDSRETGLLLRECYERALWLLAAGTVGTSPEDQVQSVRITRDVFERAQSSMSLDRTVFIEVLTDLQADTSHRASLRGACAGALWSLSCADQQSILRDLNSFAHPEELGDFLTGLFALAHEEAQQDPQLLSAIHQYILTWDDQEFLTALPSLRLAFMSFTSREKSHLAAQLFMGQDPSLSPELTPLEVPPHEAAAALTFETNLLNLAKTYGVTLDS